MKIIETGAELGVRDGTSCAQHEERLTTSQRIKTNTSVKGNHRAAQSGLRPFKVLSCPKVKHAKEQCSVCCIRRRFSLHDRSERCS